MTDVIGKETLKRMRLIAWYNDWLFRAIESSLAGNILEIGSGIGNFTELLTKKGVVTTVDINQEYLALLKKKSNLNFHVGYGDIESGKMFFKDKKFDSLVCMNVLEHIEDDLRALNNMYNLLKKGGKLCLLVPAHKVAYGSLDRGLGHKRRYSKEELFKKLNNSGFKKVDLRYLNATGIFGWFLSSRILKAKIIPKNQLTIFNVVARPVLLLEKIFKFPFGLSLLAVAEK